MAGLASAVQQPEGALAEAAVHLDQGVLLSDGQGIVWTNAAAARLLGRDADALSAMGYEDLLGLVAPEDRAWVQRINRDRREGRPAPGAYEATFLQDDGTRVELRVSVTPLPRSGLLLVVLEDVTARRRTERELDRQRVLLERRTREVAGMLKAASHDMREPLRMVHSHLQLVQRHLDGAGQDDDAQVGRDFAVALEGARRIEAFLDDVVAFAEAADRPLDVEDDVDLDACLDRALAGLADRVAKTGAEVTRDPLPHLAADPAEIADLFARLLDNALTYAGDAPPRVHVGARRDGGRGAEAGGGGRVGGVDGGGENGGGGRGDRAGGSGQGTWVLSVRDEGVGIPDHKQDLIFHPFQRLHTWNEVPGTGLGLAICQRIVDRHGGRIWVESTEGRGTTVSFTLGPAGPGGSGGAGGAAAG